MWYGREPEWPEDERRAMAAALERVGVALDDPWARHLCFSVRLMNGLVLGQHQTIRELLEAESLWRGRMKNVGHRSVEEAKDQLTELAASGPIFRHLADADERAQLAAAAGWRVIPPRDTGMVRRALVDGATFAAIAEETGSRERTVQCHVLRALQRLKLGFGSIARDLIEERVGMRLDQPFVFHAPVLGTWFSEVSAPDARVLLHAGTPGPVFSWNDSFLTTDVPRCRSAIRDEVRVLHREGPKPIDELLRAVHTGHGLQVDEVTLRAALAATSEVDAGDELVVPFDKRAVQRRGRSRPRPRRPSKPRVSWVLGASEPY